jgi:hypothetical protein
MAGIVSGLFGIDPEALAQQRQAQQDVQAMQYARMDPSQQGTYGAVRAGQMVGNLGAGLLGVQDPQLIAAQKAQSLIGDFDLTTAKGLKDYSKALLEEGKTDKNQYLMNFGMMALEKAKATEAGQSKLDLENAQTLKALRELPGGINTLIGKSTPASVAKYNQTGKVEDLVLAPKGSGAKISFGSERYGMDKTAAVDFLKTYGYTPNSKIPDEKLINNPALAQAQRIALRPTGSSGGGQGDFLILPSNEQD